jgi:copper homeostasis protein
MEFQLEICANSIESALAAQQGGANRIELCDNMAEGGTTPSAGMILQCTKLLTIPVFPIIRPRGGDFLYTVEEFQVMKQDILFCKNSGCDGVVIGMLKADGSVDSERCAELIALARPMKVTFHRAFDHCNDLKKALEAIISLGCERLLTSGGNVFAEDSIEILEELVLQSNGRISIMPGSGVNESNIDSIAKNTRAYEFHSTAKAPKSSLMNYVVPGDLAPKGTGDNIWETDLERVKQMKRILTDMLPAT